MTLIGLLKALGLAVLVLAANLLLTVAVVFAYSQACADVVFLFYAMVFFDIAGPDLASQRDVYRDVFGRESGRAEP